MATGSIVANPSPPAAPSGLTASQSGHLVQLTWQDNSSNETVFYIERCQGVGCTNFASFVATQWPDVPSYTDYSAVTGQRYSYRVRAYNGGGYSAYSNIASILVGAANQPPTAVISAVPTTGVAPLSVAFNGSAVDGSRRNHRDLGLVLRRRHLGERAGDHPRLLRRGILRRELDGDRQRRRLEHDLGNHQRHAGRIERADRADEPGRELEHPRAGSTSRGSTPPPTRRRSPCSAAAGARARGLSPSPSSPRRRSPGPTRG